MQFRVSVLILAVLLPGATAPAAATSPDSAALLPAPAGHPIAFKEEIKPILEASCTKCHGRGKSKGGFRLDTRGTLLKGGDSGPAVLAGNSAESLLIALVAGSDPDNVMPQKGSRLTPDQIGLLRAWIDQGLPWDKDVSFGPLEPNNLKPRLPVAPARPPGGNPVDGFLQRYFDQHQIKPPPSVNDRIFARRAYLDTIGLLPPPVELEEFVRDRRSDKRQRLVQRLLADNRNYAEHWMTFWNDLLRNDYRGTGYIDGGRKQISAWLYSALLTNLPYDRFVAQLVNPAPDSEGFTKGIVWRGVVNASQTPQLQAAQNISQVFMGVNLKCASCHDSFINDLTLADAYGLAGVYADGPLEMVQCDKPTGKKAELKFLYPELGAIDPKADKPARLKRLAEILTQRQDGRLTRTLVNRLWQKLMGRGLIEPVDDMEKSPWDADLLDWLAEDFASHNYDVKHLIQIILSSQAYELPAVNLDEQARADFVFRGPSVRRMTAEEFRDALYALTGSGGAVPVSGYDFLKVYVPAQPVQGSELELSQQARWIWNDRAASLKVKPGEVFFRREFRLSSKPTQATAIVSCDDSFALYANGEVVGGGDDVSKPKLYDLVPWLKAGTNVLAVAANNRDPNDKEKEKARENQKAKQDEAAKSDENIEIFGPKQDPNTPAGLLVIARIEQEIIAEGRTMAVAAEFSSDSNWRWSDKKVEHWEKPDFVMTNWGPAIELGGVQAAPWKLAGPLTICNSVVPRYGNFRAPLLAADVLTVALGRPNREQIVTTRPMTATTLQALELTNGDELAEMIRRGAEKMLDLGRVQPTREMVRRLYERALGRGPTREELALALGLVGQPARESGLEDLMWAMIMLPEFQLIY